MARVQVLAERVADHDLPRPDVPEQELRLLKDSEKARPCRTQEYPSGT